MARAWPLMQCLADFTAGPPNLPSAASVDLFAPSSQTALRAFGTARGRQYELGTVQAGTLALDLTDSLERLNPVNASSPWNSGGNSLLPYRCTQIGAYWNPATKDVTGNLLNSTNAIYASQVRFDPSFESGTSGFFAPSGAPVMTTSTAQHFTGAQSLSVVFASATDSAGIGIPTPTERQLTLSVYVFVPASHTATVSWINFTGTYGTTIGTATSSTTGAWQRLTITGVPSSVVTVMKITCSAAYPATVFVDAMQLELGPTASAFSLTGPTYFPVFTGYVERYPQTWDSAGFRGIKPLAAVDALSVLSRTIISQSYASTVLADAPAVYIPYSDDAFPQITQRITGGQPMIGYQELGSNSGTVNFGGDTVPDGTKAVALAQQNTSPITPPIDGTQITTLGTRTGDLTMNAQAFTFECWVRWSSGQFSFGVGMMQPGESTIGATTGPAHRFGIQVFSNFLQMIYVDDAGSLQINTFFIETADGSKIFADGQWHYISLQLLGSNTWSRTFDTRSRVPGSFVVGTPPTAKINNIYALVTTAFGDPIANISVANVALYPFALSAGQRLNHYQRGAGYIGELSGARALRLLTQYWSTNVITDIGKSTMAPDFSYNGRSMLDVLQEIADTEAGLVWVDSAGLVHQDSRETRYVAPTSATSQFTFGENTAGGELPYLNLEYDYDPTYVFSEADFTSGGSGTQIPPVINATSQTAYGQRILSKTLQMAVDWDVQQAAQFYVQRYAKPAGTPGSGTAPRISKMTIDASSNPNLWAAALDLDIGNRVTVKRRTSAGVTISGDYYIEQINHSVNAEASTWKVDYQLSPVFVSQPWILGDAAKGVLGTTTVCVY